MTALTVALCALFVHLGEWQWHKAEWRQAEWNAFARGADRAVPLGTRGTAGVQRFQRVTATGRFEPNRQFLLDNRIQDDDPGYEVLTPFELDDGRVLLVDRGWVPFTGLRSRLPDIHLTASGPVTITGRVDGFPVAGLSFGRAPPPAGDRWPKVTSYPDMAQLAAALRGAAARGEPARSASASTGSLALDGGARLEPQILLLDPSEPFGYVRKWQPPGMSPARYMSYAAQWWLFAVTLVIIWLVLSTPKRRPAPPRSEPSPSVR
jgi:cytochrome oxidase assembly protein ShyY1